MNQTPTQTLRYLFSILRYHFGGTPAPGVPSLTWPVFNRPNDDGQRATGPTLSEIARHVDGAYALVGVGRPAALRNIRVCEAQLVDGAWINLLGVPAFDDEGHMEQTVIRITPGFCLGELDASERS